MGRGGCRAIQCLLEVINTLFIVMGLTLVVGGSIFVYLTLDLPGPASTAAIVTIVLGVVVTVLGMFGYTAARERKILGSEFKGKVKLFVYAGVMGAVFVTLMSLGIVLLVWLGDGAVPDTGHSQTNKAAGVVVDKAKDPVHNFVGCVYDVCCITKVANKTTFPVETCRMDGDGVPDHRSPEVFSPSMSGDDIDPTNYEQASKSCEKFSQMLNKKTCEHGSFVFRQAVAKWMNDNVRPLGYLVVIMSSLIFVAWVFAILEFFWCCGESDLPDEIDDTKIAPSEYDDDY